MLLWDLPFVSKYNRYREFIAMIALHFRISIAGVRALPTNDAKPNHHRGNANRQHQPDRNSKPNWNRAADDGDARDEQRIRHLSADVGDMVAAAGL